tara:strand:- start:2180 stop:2542 length:363 start_codon:yes stop_codon:yes gene_type:complete
MSGSHIKSDSMRIEDYDLFSHMDGGTLKSMTLDFQDFDRENPKVWEMFCRFAHEAIASGRKVLSASLIVERIRWEVFVVTSGDDFKINNNFRAFYARKFMREYPVHGEMFRTRKSEADAA